MDPSPLITSSGMVDNRFTNLRKKLDQLGYHQSFGIESLPLVEKLFHDLVQTTESFRNVKAEATHLQQLSKSLEKSVEPYKKENGRLLTENNRFQQQLVVQKEKWENALKAQKSASRKTEQENAELRFLNSQYLLKVNLLEKESQDKSEQIMQLQEKNLQAVVLTPGGRKQPIAFRRQRMEIDLPVPNAVNPDVIHRVQEQAKDVYVADMVRIADHSISQLQQKTVELTKKSEHLDSQLLDCKNQVEARDVEIRRLNKLLEDGLSPIALASENQKDMDTSDISFMLEHLQTRNEQLEKEVEELLAEGKVEARKKSLGKQKDPKTDAKTVRFEPDKKRNIKEKKIEDELWEQLKESKQTIASFKSMTEKDQRKVNDLERKLANKDEELAKLEKLIQEIHNDKDGLVGKVKELSSNERELLLEIDRLSRRVPADTPHPDTMDSLLEYTRRLESQRDQYKEEARALLRLVQSGKGKSGGTSGSNQMNDLVKVLEEERNFYKKQYQELLDETSSRDRRRAPSGAVSTIDRGTSVIDTELDDLQQEKLEQERVIQTLNKDLHEAHAQLSALMQEREEFLDHMQQANEELIQLRLAVASGQSPVTVETSRPSTSKEPDLSNAAIVELQQERDNALDRLQKLQEEHLQLNQELQKVQEDFHSEKKVLEETIRQFQTTSIKTVVSDTRRSNDSERLTHLETQIIGLQYQISQLQDEIKQLGIQVEKSDRRSDDLQREMRSKEEQISLLRETEKEQNTRIVEMHQVIENHRQDLASLQQLVSTMDEQRQQLSEGSRDKGQQISDLHYHVAVKESEAESLKLAMTSMEGIIKELQQKVEEKDRELGQLQNKVELKQKETSSFSDDKDALQRENRRLLEDLTYITSNHQRASEELHAVTNERDTLHRQIQEYITEVTRVQELLSMKEQERRELLEQYSHLSQENNLLESQNKELELQTSSTHDLLLNKDAELKSCQEAISTLEQEIQEHMATQESYNLHMSTLNTSVTEMESELQSSRSEVERLRKELLVTQQLCSTLEASKNKMHEQMTTGQGDKDQLSIRLYELSEEMSRLREQLAVSRSSVVNLEELLISTREREFRVQISKQQLSAELEMANERLKQAEHKIDDQGKEIMSLKAKLSQIEIELDKMKRQLTNEKFERERANQELRRHRQQLGLYPSPGQDVTTTPSVRFAETTSSQSRTTSSGRLAATFQSSSSGFITGQHSEEESIDMTKATTSKTSHL